MSEIVGLDFSPYQTTLQHPVTCSGIALHSGEQVSMTLHPAQAGSGIVFRRKDVHGPASYVEARYDAVCDTKLGTTICNDYGTKVMTVEHLMAALWGMRVDNCLVELEGPEIPIMDGSSEPFVFLIECAGIETQDALRPILEIQRLVTVEDHGSTATITPADHFSLDITIHFEHECIGTQRSVYDFSATSFKQSLCRARTFGFAHEVEKLREMGLARGGSLDNAIVLSEEEVMNDAGLRYADEFVRHKALDCVGDYFLAGAHIFGAVTTCRPGHGINNLLMREVFSDPANYRLTQPYSYASAPAAADARRPVAVAI
ncbi:MAG: UDP-3-O-acyl-N-acetylglucosamine deacetylase [Rickettsiales bacterium]|nr:UDP-3-O-acyl-N-acetylglucosamine deacetylase [Rickettsiales bacterium]